MLFEYDLAGAAFEHLDFCDSVLCFPFFERIVMPRSLEIGVWGATFYPNIFALDPALVPDGFTSRRSAGLFLQDWAVIRFESTVRLEIEVKPYLPNLDLLGEFVKQDGKIQVLTREMGKEDIGAESYLFEATLEHPYGDVQLEIWASGAVTFQGNSKWLLPDSKRSPDRHWSDRRRMSP